MAEGRGKGRNWSIWKNQKDKKGSQRKDPRRIQYSMSDEILDEPKERRKKDSGIRENNPNNLIYNDVLGQGFGTQPRGDCTTLVTTREETYRDSTGLVRVTKTVEERSYEDKRNRPLPKTPTVTKAKQELEEEKIYHVIEEDKYSDRRNVFEGIPKSSKGIQTLDCAELRFIDRGETNQKNRHNEVMISPLRTQSESAIDYDFCRTPLIGSETLKSSGENENDRGVTNQENRHNEVMISPLRTQSESAIDYDFCRTPLIGSGTLKSSGENENELELYTDEITTSRHTDTNIAPTETQNEHSEAVIHIHTRQKAENEENSSTSSAFVIVSMASENNDQKYEDENCLQKSTVSNYETKFRTDDMGGNRLVNSERANVDNVIENEKSPANECAGQEVLDEYLEPTKCSPRQVGEDNVSSGSILVEKYDVVDDENLDDDFLENEDIVYMKKKDMDLERIRKINKKKIDLQQRINRKMKACFEDEQTLNELKKEAQALKADFSIYGRSEVGYINQEVRLNSSRPHQNYQETRASRQEIHIERTNRGSLRSFATNSISFQDIENEEDSAYETPEHDYDYDYVDLK